MCCCYVADLFGIFGLESVLAGLLQRGGWADVYLGLRPRSARFPTTGLLAAEGKEIVANVAAAQRANARASGLFRARAPLKDPLWVAMNTAADCRRQEITAVAPANTEDAIALGAGHHSVR